MTRHPQKIELACTCGKLRGHAIDLSPKTGVHLVCMCKDCQAFARFLGREDELLDSNGGSEVFQSTPSQIKLEVGLEHLACVRLSPKGLLRWYASCCDTPVANTAPAPGVPFASLVCAFIKGQPQEREAALGPIKLRTFARDGYGSIPKDAQEKFAFTSMIPAIFWILGNKIKGKARPSPFFDENRQMVVEPRILSKEERDSFTLSAMSKAPV